MSNYENIEFIRERVRLIHRAKFAKRNGAPVTSTLNRFAHGLEITSKNLERVKAYLQALGNISMPMAQAEVEAMKARGLDTD